jgi:CubicO group peptidase (beta-lactamase class C family)
MLMQLAERGRINLNDPLIKHIPEYTPKYPVNTGPTTLRQLATHTSGLHVDAAQHFWHYYSNFLWVVNKGKGKITWGVPKAEFIASLDKVEIEYTPNMYPHYSNFGYQLLGMALERVTEEPIEDYLKANVLQPLAMTNSDLRLDDGQRSRFAVGYVFLEPDFDRYLAPEWDLDIIKYSGGLYSTPEDIARFISWQFRDQEDNDPQLLSGDALRLMRSPQTLRGPRSNDTYGIGWAMYDHQGHRVIAHAGGHWGFAAKAEFLPDLKLGVVIMTNCNYPQGYLGPEKGLTKIIYEKFVAILQKQKTEPVFNPQNMDLQQYVGHYAVAGDYAHAQIYVDDDRLYLSLLEKADFDAPFLPVGSHRFWFAEDPGKNQCFALIQITLIISSPLSFWISFSKKGNCKLPVITRREQS